jgi:hypothetical protein
MRCKLKNSRREKMLLKKVRRNPIREEVAIAPKPAKISLATKAAHVLRVPKRMMKSSRSQSSTLLMTSIEQVSGVAPRSSESRLPLKLRSHPCLNPYLSSLRKPHTTRLRLTLMRRSML